MNWNDAATVYQEGKKRPIRTVVIVVIFIILVAVSAYTYSYFNEKGKQQAQLPNVNNKLVDPEQAVQDTIGGTNSPKISQHAEGIQSPNIISHDANITYNNQNANK